MLSDWNMAERRLTISKLDAREEPLLSYPGEMMYEDEQLVVARCRFAPLRDVDLGDVLFRRGDVLIEFYYRRQPFNIFALYSPIGQLKAWYCNVVAYNEIADGQIRWADLALDLLVLPDGEQIVLDADEFEALGPSAEERDLALAALEILSTWASERKFPFDLPH